jgi:hypothetical protein
MEVCPPLTASPVVILSSDQTKEKKRKEINIQIDDLIILVSHEFLLMFMAN